MARAYLMGLDIGTSGTKALLIDERGEILASHTEEYPLAIPAPGWAEQDALHWWQASQVCIRSVLRSAAIDPAALKGISLSGQMHGLVPLDGAGEPLRPAILWCDQRTEAECADTVRAAGGLDGLLACTNNSMLTGYTGGKLLWMRKHEPDLFARMRIFLNPKDYILYRLTGEQSTEVSDASGTGFFDVRTRRWHDGLIAKLGLPRSIFPRCLESADVAGRVTTQVAAATGLPQGLPVVAGGGDAVIQTTGMGLVSPGIVGVVIGTSGVVAMGLDDFAPNPGGKLQVFCGNAPSLWHAMGVTLAAGGSYRWYRDTLCGQEVAQAAQQGRGVYDIMGEAAAASAPGAGQLIFLPYLQGERCPYPDPAARGAFVGLSLAHTKGDITRAVMEGISCSLKQVGDLLLGLLPRVTPKHIIASGGGAASPLWRQILADLYQLPVHTLAGNTEGGAYSAALLAGVGAGLYKDLGEAFSVLHTEHRVEPIPANAAVYQHVFTLYSGLYSQLQPAYAQIDRAARENPAPAIYK
ncbi:MAG: xylulokinase [Oscillospiraceae bacterium]|jgi:xylulokinase|nr:xylulokinase [Oscillospiraceae bacterium]